MSVCTSNMNSSALSVNMETPLHIRQISNNNLSSTNTFLLLSPVNVRIEINFSVRLNFIVKLAYK